MIGLDVDGETDHNRQMKCKCACVCGNYNIYHHIYTSFVLIAFSDTFQLIRAINLPKYQ